MGLLISTICFLSLFLYIIYETDAIADYFYFLGIKLPYLNEYIAARNTGVNGLYIKYIRNIYKDNFWIKLTTCFLCVSIYLSCLLSIILDINMFIVDIGGLIIFLILKLLNKYSN